MKRYAFGGWSLVVFALTMGASPVAAQGGSSQPPRAWVAEVTPFISMGSPTSSRVGGAITFPVTSSLSVETEVGYRRGEGDVNALSTSVGVLHFLPHVGRVAPYVAAGIGLAEHGSPLVLPGRTEIFTQSQLAVTVNAGGA